MTFLRIILLFVSSYAWIISPSQYLSNYVGIPADSVGLYIEEINTGNVILDVNGEKRFIPASVTKILTAASALRELSSECRFKTDIYLNGSRSDSTFIGNIIISSNYDPTLESSHFPTNKGLPDSIACRLRNMGITDFNGKIIYETTANDDLGIPFGWEKSDLIWPYGAVLRSFNFSDNSFQFNVSTGESTPFIPTLSVSRCSERNLRPLCYDMDNDSITVNTRKIKTGTESYAMRSPREAFCAALVRAMESCGISIRDSDSLPSADSTLLLTHYSPTLTDILGVMMKRSDNLFAEGILIAQSPSFSRDEALAGEINLWKKSGIDMSDISVFDGSGLSRKNKITPYFLADILFEMARSKKAETFINTFPVAGVSGTVRNFLKDTELEGKLALKSGSMSNVQCYAGYRLNQAGNPTHIVVLMINGFKESRATVKKALQALLLEKLL